MLRNNLHETFNSLVQDFRVLLYLFEIKSVSQLKSHVSLKYVPL